MSPVLSSPGEGVPERAEGSKLRGGGGKSMKSGLLKCAIVVENGT